MVKVLTKVNPLINRNVLNIRNYSLIKSNFNINKYLIKVNNKQVLSHSPLNSFIDFSIKSVSKSHPIYSKSFVTFADNNDSKMPPINGSNYSQLLDKLINENRVLIFSKTSCPFCTQVLNFIINYLINNLINFYFFCFYLIFLYSF
jgi:uncharacterized protein YvpB